MQPRDADSGRDEVKVPVDYQQSIGATGMGLLVGIMFVGAMTAPFAQRGRAAVVFPVLVFVAITLMTQAGPQQHGLSIVTLLETAVSCAVPGGLVYLRWRRRELLVAP